MIEVVEYDPRWPDSFARLCELYAGALSDRGVPVVAIEHVGSTAVPGLAAKPIIDVDIIVRPEQVEPAAAVLESLGFRPVGELGIPQRWAFKEPVDLARTNTYVVVDSSLALKNHRAVRDLLCCRADLREQYAAVKRAAGVIATDIDEYGQMKNAMIQRILAAAGLSAQELASIDSNQGPGPEVPR